MALATVLLCGCPPPSVNGTGDGTAATAASSEPTSAPTAAPSGTATAGGEPTGSVNPADGRAKWVGNWVSPSCGERKYPRVINLGADGSFSAQERVSPCVSPPGGPPIQCVWSGIVNYRGGWQLAGEGITLAQTGGDTAPGKITTASALSWSTEQGAPAEPSDASCVYQRAKEEPSSKATAP
jgi:hypothetical protein